MVIGVPALALIGCSYPNQFKDRQPREPHALLTAARGDSWRDRGPLINFINGQPTSFWRTRERFLISPGPMKLEIIADSSPYRFGTLGFTAETGYRYHVVYEDKRSSVGLYDQSVSGKAPVLVARAPRLNKSE